MHVRNSDWIRLVSVPFVGLALAAGALASGCAVEHDEVADSNDEELRRRRDNSCPPSATDAGATVEASAPVDAGSAPKPDAGAPPPPAPTTTPPPAPPPPSGSGSAFGSVDIGSGPPAGQCDLTATPANFTTQFNAAQAGQVVCLAAGSYGSFKGSAKSGMVTLRPQAGATATMSLAFNGAKNIRIEGMTVGGGTMLNSTRDIIVTGSRFTGHLTVDGVANSNIVLDHNTHVGILTCSGCSPASIHLSYSAPTHSGVTIQHSLFADSNSDGIQTGIGVNILGNEFRNIKELGPNDSAHSDPIQLIGASYSVVRGNWIHDCADGIVAYDGIDHALIEDNVVDLISGRWGIELYEDDGSIVRHNTLRYATTCEYSPCGDIDIVYSGGTGTSVYDNIATWISASSGGSFVRRDHNMVRQSLGAGDFIGVPVFVGGAAPTTYAGYKLAAGSPGKGAASDGADVGIR